MLVLDLAVKSLRNRAFSTSLTVGSIALSVALLIGVENVRVGVRESFSNTISQTDLVVGARGGTTQLLLYSVFGMGSPTQNISWDTYQQWAEHPAIEWTIPYGLGDSHRGYRVIGTSEDFLRHYRYRGGRSISVAEGRFNSGLYDVTLGADVAAELEYAIGDEVEVTHGLDGFMDHDHMPFTVVGVLDKTFTPVDRALYITMEGLEAVHFGWEDGAPPGSAMPGGAEAEDDHAHEEDDHAHAEEDEHDHAEEDEAAHAEDDHAHAEDEDHDHAEEDEDDHAHEAEDDHAHAEEDEHDHAEEDEAAHAEDEHAHAEDEDAHAEDEEGAHAHAHDPDLTVDDVEVTQLAAFFVGTSDRRDALGLQREINEFEDEPMSAVLPGVALNEMWQGLGYAETGLRLVTIFVVLVGLLGMLVALYTSLNERRREMAILRAVGAGPNRIVALLVLESVVLATVGAIAGMALAYVLLSVGQPVAEAQAGLFVPITPPGLVEWVFLGSVVVAGFLIGFVPALKAYRTTLHDGLAVRA